MDIIISDLGDVWSPNGALLSAGALGPGALSGRQIGAKRRYVNVSIDRSGACLRLGAAPITQACLERLASLLNVQTVNAPEGDRREIDRRTVNRIMVEYGGGRAAPELFTSLEDVVEWLAENWLEQISSMAQPPLFRLKRLDLARLNERGRLNEPGRLSMLAEFGVWKRARGRLSPKAIERESGAINGRRMVIRVCGLRLQMRAVSDVSVTYRPCERMRMLSQDVECQPDAVYGEYLAGSFQEFAANDAGEPGLQEVQATITRSDGRLVQVRYDRLVLPWKSQGGDRWITSQPILRRRREMLD